MKIWQVWGGDWDGDWVVASYQTRELAELHIASLPDGDYHHIEDADVLDELPADIAQKGRGTPAD